MTLRVKPASHGMTLTEVLVASALALVVVVGIGRLDVARFQIGEDIRRVSVGRGIGHQETALAALHLSKHFEVADRLLLINSGVPGSPPFAGGPAGFANVQLRIPVCPAVPPTPACYDVATSYRWDQFVRNGAELRYYSNTDTAGCGNLRVLAREIGSFTLTLMDTATLPPPGGESFDPPAAPADNNVVEYALLWDNGAAPTPLTHEFRGMVAARSVTYSDLNTNCAGPGGPCDSGTSLTDVSVSVPQPLCP